MPRYIDADKLWNDRPLIPKGKSQDYMAGFSECMWGFSKRMREQIDNSTADVVPRADVEEIFEEVDSAMIDHAQGDIDNHWLYVRIAELKKKYTGGDQV